MPRSANVIAHLTFPVAVFAITAPAEVIHLLLGAQWTDAAPMLRWLALAAAGNQATSLAIGACVAAGWSDRLIPLALVSLPVVAGAVAVGASQGPGGIAFGMAVALTLLAFVRVWWTLRGSAVTLAGYLRSLAGPSAVGVALALGAFAGRSAALSSGWPLRLGAALAGGSVAVGVLFAASATLRSEWTEVWAHLPWRRATTRPIS